MAAPNVEFVLPALSELLPLYDKVDHCVDDLVKSKGDIYLPRPNPEDTSYENTLRYESYQTRAVFYNVTARTLNGLVGQIYANAPEVELPGVLKNLEKDANGKGVGIVQSSKAAVDFAFRHGRLGLYIDYPKLEKPATRKQLDDGEVKPSISVYASANIINWRPMRRLGKWVYSLIVLKENYEVESDDGFEVKTETQYRVLRLVNDIYIVEIWRKDTGIWDKTISVPVGADGQPFNEIPFTFVGAVNNDPAPDQPPLYSLAELNIAHYRNSADHEESCFIVGQPLIVTTGLTEEWLDKVLGGKIRAGSRGGLPLGVGADAKVLQVAPNVMPMEAMLHKEKQMVAIGAKLVEDREVQQTATEATINNAAETSILATIANNVSAGYQFALEWAAKFVGVTGAPKFQLNTEFAITKLSPQERTALIAEWQAGAISWTELREKLHGGGIATQDDAKALAEIEAANAKKADEAADAAKKLADAVPQPVKPVTKK